MHNYEAPAVIFETRLEVRAGTPLTVQDPNFLFRSDDSNG
jgi:hypothetical protein